MGFPAPCFFKHLESVSVVITTQQTDKSKMLQHKHFNKDFSEEAWGDRSI
jgi:hypothetical protein